MYPPAILILPLVHRLIELSVIPELREAADMDIYSAISKPLRVYWRTGLLGIGVTGTEGSFVVPR